MRHLRVCRDFVGPRAPFQGRTRGRRATELASSGVSSCTGYVGLDPVSEPAASNPWRGGRQGVNSRPQPPALICTLSLRAAADHQPKMFFFFWDLASSSDESFAPARPPWRAISFFDMAPATRHMASSDIEGLTSKLFGPQRA